MMTVLRFPCAERPAPTLLNFIRQNLQARADARLRLVPDHMIGPATDAADAAIARVMAAHAEPIAEIERELTALIAVLDSEVPQ